MLLMLLRAAECNVDFADLRCSSSYLALRLLLAGVQLLLVLLLPQKLLAIAHVASQILRVLLLESDGIWIRVHVEALTVANCVGYALSKCSTHLAIVHERCLEAVLSSSCVRWLGVRGHIRLGHGVDECRVGSKLAILFILTIIWDILGA